MTPLPRIHGGTDAAGPARFDFSTNANACGPCPAAQRAVRDADPTRYPDGSHAALRERLAARHGVDPARIVVAASGSEWIFRLTAWAARAGFRRVRVPALAYGDYADAARAWGMAVERYVSSGAAVRTASAAGAAPAADGAGAPPAPDRPAPSAAVPAAPADPAAPAAPGADGDGGPALVWACDPSSPRGLSAPPPPVRPGDLLAIDRAYAPLRLSGGSQWTADDLDRAWQLWSPNKALGLTGVRGAYAIAPAGGEAAAAELDALAPSWPLGAHGVAMLDAWCGAAAIDWLHGSLAILRTWLARQQETCAALGWQVLPSDTPFFCARPPVPAQFAALRAAGVQLRDTASFGLAGHLRVSVQRPVAQDALRDAWNAAHRAR
ncbi:MAG: aminotransferase class I/II-fold pyridoxal phosphate-dependent enzyme [Xylophilus ampelinus]